MFETVTEMLGAVYIGFVTVSRELSFVRDSFRATLSMFGLVSCDIRLRINIYILFLRVE